VLLLLTIIVVVDAEGALDLAPLPRLNHHHAADRMRGLLSRRPDSPRNARKTSVTG
jgi:hypothetical protein